MTHAPSFQPQQADQSPGRPIPKMRGGLPGLGHVGAFVRDAIGLLFEARRQCGDVAHIKVAHMNLVALSGPEASEAFFRAPDSQLDPAEAYKLMVPVFGKDVVYDAPPDKMQAQIKMLQPALRVARMKAYGQLIAEEVAASLESWGDEGEIDFVRYCQTLTNFTSSRCLLGPEFRGEMNEEFSAVYFDLERGITPLAFINPYLPTPSFRLRDKARVRLVEMIGDVMRSRRAIGSEGDDFLQTLMESRYADGRPLSEHEITGMILAAMFAGHHTSSVTAAWTLLELLQDPVSMRRVTGELDRVYGPSGEVTYDSLRDIHETEYAIKETLRLHPPLFMLMRKVKEPFEVCGHVVPPGWFAVLSPTVSHRIPEVYPQPDRFDPQRFAPPIEADRDPFRFLAFGGGRHRCLGNAFALLQIKTIFAILLRSYEFELTGDPVEADFHGLVVGPKLPCRVRYRRLRDKPC
jgi:sterol 14-demethylase